MVVPIVALTVLAFQRIDSERTAATRAREVAALVQLQRDVSAVYPYANLERIALEGLSRVDELGVPRNLVKTMSGVDLEGITSTNAELLDRSLDRLAERHPTLALPDGTGLGERLRGIRIALDEQRGLSEERIALGPDVQAVFDELSSVLGDALASTNTREALPPEFAAHATSMRALSDVLVSGGEYGQAVLNALLLAQSDTREEAGRRHAVHEALLDVFERSIDPGEAAEVGAVRTGLREFVGDVPISEQAGQLGVTDPAVISAATAAILDLFDYLSDLEQYSADFHEQVQADVTGRADAADTRVANAWSLLAMIAVVTAGLIVAVMLSILRPLRGLTTRAEAITNGVLDLEPLAVRGPTDIRALTVTMNEMLGTLHRVNGEITRLAAGDIDATTVPDLPGAIGISMRDSVRHLATVTAQLQRSEQLSSAIVTQAADAIWTVGPDGRIRTANEASEQLTRVARARQIGMPITDLLTAISGEAAVKTPLGPNPKVLVATSVIDAGDDIVTAVIAHDISERTRFEERLAYQAHHDALTGLPNRFAVLERLDEILRTEPNVAVLFVDLDSFKSVNDTHGHAVGDQVLGAVGTILTRCVRSSEFVGRLGGDEFVIIVRDVVEATDALTLGYRVIRELEQPQEHDGHVFVLSASVGVAFPEIGTSALDAIRHADSAVYQAKRRGRGRVERFDAAMQEQIEHEAAVELALRQAVRNDELRIHLQPVFDLATDRISGAEALVRWERPGFGLVPPNDFIPIAERSSLIFEVERWVLTQACERIAAWRQMNASCDYRVAVNISGRHLIEGDLLTDVERALALSGADPTMLELELTETQLLEDLDRATSVLDALRARGITIAVDDFGTGYSSMTYLRHLPIDTVKIDRSFVARATEHGYDSTVIEALITVASALGLTVVAEGIETEGQLDYVRSHGCHRGQGYLLARPMPVIDAEAMMCDLSHPGHDGQHAGATAS